MIAATVKAARGRVPVIAGAGGNATSEALALTKASQDAGADARSGRLFSLQAGAANSNARRLARLGPIDGTRDQFAIAVSLDDVGDHRRRQGALASENLAAACDGAVGLEVFDEQFELGPGRALDAERARHVTFGDASGRLHAVRRGRAGEKGEHLVA